MKTKTIIAGTVLSVTWCGFAAAQEDQRYDDPETGDTLQTETVVLAPERAFEIGVQGGYTQPFGELTNDRNFNDLAEAGGSVGVELGWRFSPYVSLSGLGTFHEQVVADSFGGADIRGGAMTLQGTFHFRPYDRVDPYFSYGAGYRLLWINPNGENNDAFTHGFQLGRLAFGIDFRVSNDVALGPVVGADVNLFLWEKLEAESGNNRFDDPRPSTFLFAGLSGRFDVGGDRVVEGDDTPLQPTAGVGF